MKPSHPGVKLASEHSNRYAAEVFKVSVATIERAKSQTK